MKRLFHFGVILGIICCIATLVLAVTYQVTKPKIDAQMRSEEQEALKSIMPEADSFTQKELDGYEYFEAVKDGEIKGYCLRLTGTGYGGFIRLVAGVRVDGAITGIAILEHQETPGLGAQINQIKPGEKDPWFLRQFKGKDVSGIYVKKNIDAITGATISSKAVTDTVREETTKFLTKVKPQ